jgi:hypothetical protein
VKEQFIDPRVNIITHNFIREKIKEIPEDVNKISNEQWDWILDLTKDEGLLKLEFRCKIINKLGFGHSLIFNKEANQPILCIKREFPKWDKSIGKNGGWLVSDETQNNPEKIKKGFEIIRQYLKPIEETSIVFEVCDLKKCSSVLFVSKRNVKLVETDEKIKEFKNFGIFIDWLFDQYAELIQMSG